jgi:hypothetical protein
MKVTSAALLACLSIAGEAWAFNAIHQASYDLEPHGNHAYGTHLSIAGIIDSRATDYWMVPASIALRASPQVEFGAGIQTRWGSAQDHVPYLVFGVKWLTRTKTSVQADLLVPANVDNGKGFSIATFHKYRHFPSVGSHLAVRMGFMEALVDDDAVLAFETGWYPTLFPGQALSLELGLIGSSQTKRFEEHLAMDMQPSVLVNFRKASSLQASAAMGLAGDRKEELRVKCQLNHGF